MSSTDISHKIPAGGPTRKAGSATRFQQLAAKQAPDSPAVQALNKLGLSLFELVSAHLEHNVLLSPAAVAGALLSAQVCASGDTQVQLAQLMAEAGKAEHLQAAVLYAEQAIERGAANAQAAVAYRILVSRSLELNETCEQLLMSQLHCRVDRVAFNASEPEDVVAAVNDAFATSSPLLADVMSPDAVDPTAKLLLASAFYYKGVLDPPFQRCAEKRVFKPNLTTSVELEYVSGTGSFLYAEMDEPVAAKVLELPYRAGSASLLLLMPDRSPRLKEMRGQLTPAFLAKLQHLLKRRTVRVELPLTKLEARYTLNTTLFRAGVRQAFMPGAEFGGLVPTSEVRISDFLHRVTLVLDEGRPANAPDAAVLQQQLPEAATPSTDAQVPADAEFAVTRPFIFVLRQCGDGCILLIGIVRELKEAQQRQ